jgi:hypothetical protein
MFGIKMWANRGRLQCTSGWLIRDGFNRQAATIFRQHTLAYEGFRPRS